MISSPRVKILLLFIFILLITENIKSQTLVPFRKKDGKYIFVDSSNLIDARIGVYNYATFFNREGLAKVDLGKSGESVFSDIVINKKGETVFRLSGTDLEYTSDINLLFNNNNDDYLIQVYERRQQYRSSQFKSRNIIANYFISGSFISPEFVSVKNFNEGIVAFSEYVGEREKWGFLKINGYKIIDALYDQVREFNEGLAAVQSPLGWGFIDTTGSEIIKTKYLQVRNFHGGRALVLSKDKELFFIDKTGKKIFTLNQNELQLPSINIIDDFRFDKIVYSYNYKTGDVRLIDKFGKSTIIRLPMNLGELKFIGTHFYCKKNHQTTASLYDMNGKVVIDFGKYNRLLPPTEGLLPFEKDGAWGFVNLKGEVVVPSKYYEVKDFQHGLAMVKSLRGWQFINSDGVTVFSHKEHPLGQQFTYTFLKNRFIKFSCTDHFYSDIFIDIKGRRFYEE